MKYKLLLLLVVLILPISLFSQTMYPTKDGRYREIADSLFRQNISFDFDKAIKFYSAYDYYYSDEDMLIWYKGIQVRYFFVNSANQEYSFKRVNERGGSMTDYGYRVYLDTAYNLIEPIDFNLLNKVYSHYATKLITEKEAKEVAEANSKIKTNNTKNNSLYYHVQQDKFFWKVIRVKGFKLVDIEKFEIDAHDKTLMSYTTYPFDRGFWRALKEKVFGYTNFY